MTEVIDTANNYWFQLEYVIERDTIILALDYNALLNKMYNRSFYFHTYLVLNLIWYLYAIARHSK